MSGHPVNQALRFLLEMATLVAIGYWGWVAHAPPWGLLWGMALPALIMVVWATLRSPVDPSPAPVPLPVPGWARLALEAAVFSGGVATLCGVRRPSLAVVLASALALHYALSYDRVVAMVTPRSPTKDPSEERNPHALKD